MSMSIMDEVLVEPIEIPLVRGGEEYLTKRRVELFDYRSKKIGEVSECPSIILSQAQQKTKTEGLKVLRKEMKIGEIIDGFRNAADIFRKGDIPIGKYVIKPDDYAKLATLSTGIPVRVVEQSMEAIKSVMDMMEEILKVQTPDGRIEAYDDFIARRNGACFGWVPRGKDLGVVLPSNHMGTNILWLICYAIKYSTIIRPSSDEVFTPIRLAKSFYEAGFPKHTLYVLPSGYELIPNLIDGCDRSIIFGSEHVTRIYKNHSNVKTFGPGRSKIIVGEDMCHDIELVKEIVVESMISGGGRGCINASALIVPGNGDEIARAVAEEISKIRAIDPLDPRAKLPAIKDRKMAEKMNGFIELGLKNNGAEDITAEFRDSGRFIKDNGTSFILPTVIKCNSYKHPLFGVELLSPFLTIAQVNDCREMFEAARDSLSLSVITEDKNLVHKLLLEPSIQKVYNGNHVTCALSPAEPHEGFLTEFLYQVKAYRPNGEFLAPQQIKYPQKYEIGDIPIGRELA